MLAMEMILWGYMRGRHHQSASSERWENSLQLWLQGRLGFASAWHHSAHWICLLVCSSVCPFVPSPRCTPAPLLPQAPFAARVGRRRDLSNMKMHLVTDTTGPTCNRARRRDECAVTRSMHSTVWILYRLNIFKSIRRSLEHSLLLFRESMFLFV